MSLVTEFYSVKIGERKDTKCSGNEQKGEHIVPSECYYLQGIIIKLYTVVLNGEILETAVLYHSVVRDLT